MCGIAGYLGGEHQLKLNHALKNISHRGPDHEETWTDAEIGLGHRRLSIIDISSASNQPMHIDNRYVIVFNGEIYNYKELREELQTFGDRFATDSDTEVLARTILRFGAEGLNKLNGMWAFALWDREERSMFLSRDRMGKKPLFYTFLADGTFVFGSEMKALYPFLPHIEINETLLRSAIKNNFGYEHTEECLIQNIKRFPRASFTRFNYKTERELAIKQFWTPQLNNTKVSSEYKEQAAQLRYLIEDSCRLRMRSDVKTGTALSGGLDSSVITAAIHAIGGDQNENFREAFVASFPGTELDETQYALSLAEHLNLPCNVVEIDPYKDIDSIFRQSYLFEEYYYALPLPFVQLYKRIKENGITVSLDGHGADELFGGYPFDLVAGLADAMPNPLKFLSQQKAINALSGNDASENRFNNFKYALATRYSFFQRLSKNTPRANRVDGLDFLNARLYKSTFETVLPTLLRNYDRYSMINGVEIRMPFLDYRIVEFAFSIPGNAKLRDGFSKAIVREAFKDLIPDTIRERKQKIGFNPPINSWMHKQLKSWIKDNIHSTDFRNCPFINSDEVFRDVNSILDNEKEISFLHANSVFERLMPYIWFQSFQKIREFSR